MLTICRHRIAYAVLSVQLAACAQLTRLPPEPYPSSPNARFDRTSSAFSYRLVHNFGRGIDGNTPLADLVVLNGKLYGTTEYGGEGGNGTVFRVGVGGSESILHSFRKSPDGEFPVSGLITVGKAATLYGTTEFGGRYKLGAVFEITTSGKEHVLYSFKGGDDGAKPMGNLVAMMNGKVIELFGTTSQGGVYNVTGQTYGLGTAFKITISGKNVRESILHSFGSPGDGATPQAGLVWKENEFYGTTTAGGGFGDGALFKLSSTGTESVLKSFQCSNGKDPVARLTKLGETLYGTTAQGGIGCTSGDPKGGYGTVFSFGSGDTLRVVYNFGASPDGEVPLACLTLYGGTFYGTASAGGANGNGAIVSLSPAGGEKVLYSFGHSPDGALPAAAPIRMGAFFYGTTSAGGKYGGGVVYAFAR